MSNYASLKSAIQQVVKTNRNNEITGDLLQQTLLAMVNSLGKGYQFMDIATPTTDPGTPDQNVFYIANEKGAYTNFGGINIDEDGVFLLLYNGAWTKLLVANVTNADSLDKILADLGYIKKSAIAPVLADLGYIKKSAIAFVLTAVLIFADNSTEHKKANVDNLAAYIAWLQELGATEEEGITIPFKYYDPDMDIPFAGLLMKFSGCFNGIVPDLATTGMGVKFITISEEGEVTFKKLAYATD